MTLYETIDEYIVYLFQGLINYKDLFVAPSFDELEQVATDPFGNLKKLTESQLNSVWNKG